MKNNNNYTIIIPCEIDYILFWIYRFAVLGDTLYGIFLIAFEKSREIDSYCQCLFINSPAYTNVLKQVPLAIL